MGGASANHNPFRLVAVGYHSSSNLLFSGRFARASFVGAKSTLPKVAAGSAQPDAESGYELSATFMQRGK